MVGTDGQPQGPHPHIHILPCPYDTRSNGDPEYSRGEGGGDADGRALVVARPVSISLFWNCAMNFIVQGAPLGAWTI